MPPLPRYRGIVRRVLLAALALLLWICAERQVLADAIPPRITPIPTATPPGPPPLVPELDAPLPSLRAMEGKVVSRVDVAIDDGLWADIPPPALPPLPPGEKLSGPLVRRLIADSLKSGSFADAIAHASDDGKGGARLTIRLSPRKIIETIRAELHESPLTREEVTREADLAEGGELVARDIPVYKARIKALFARRGFPAANVALGTAAGDDRSRAVVLLEVIPGYPRVLGRRVFFVTRGKPEDFTRLTEQYGMKNGARADELAILAANAQLESRLRNLGYHRATVTSDMVVADGLVVLRVRMDTGAVFEARFEGNNSYDSSALLGVLGLDTEPDLSQGHLIQKVVDFYRKRGFLDVEVTIESRGRADGHKVHLVFKIVEHRRVAVVARHYPCLKQEELRAMTNAPRDPQGIGDEIDSYLDEELPGQDFFQSPRPGGVDALLGGGAGDRTTPLDLRPNTTYFPETYDRAVRHVQELYRAEGFLSAEVGPLQVVRRRCAPGSPPGGCVPVPLPRDSEVCTYDAQGLPLPQPPPDLRFTCVPDPAKGIECEPRVVIRLPIKLGPQSKLYDAAFYGARAFSARELARAADLPMGEPVSTAKLDDARRRLLERDRKDGYAYAEASYSLDLSQDRTRARVRFQVNEQEQVFVRAIKIRGNVHTHPWTIERRIALKVDKVYGSEDVRKTQERISTLSAFSSVTVGLEDPNVPQKYKTVIVTVVERPRQYLEFSPGLSSGEGARLAVEYGHRNLFSRAIAFSSRAEISYLPTAFILDPTARKNYAQLPIEARIGTRVTVGLQFPDIGLGPLVLSALDGLGIHDLRRDFYITKVAAIPGITIRLNREMQIQFSQSIEYNNVRILAANNIKQYLEQQRVAGTNRNLLLDLGRQLNLPDGESVAFAQRAVFVWDRRDNPLDATKGTLLSSGVEHVDSFPLVEQFSADGTPQGIGHFFRLTQKLGFYQKLPLKARFAALLNVGLNQQLTSTSQTYPDRLFFLGGQDTMRGWYFSAFIPQDNIDRIEADQNKPDSDPSKFTAASQPVNGGNLMVNQRMEIRIPVRSPLETVLFTDIGNLWVDPKYPFSNGFPLRVAVGTGIRVQTPVAPLAFDLGFNVTRKSYEDPFALSFSFGLY